MIGQTNCHYGRNSNSVRLLGGSSALAFALALSVTPAMAVPGSCIPTGDAVDCTGTLFGYTNTTNLTSFTNSGSISGVSGSAGLINTGTIATLTNSGTITGDTSADGIYNSGTITTLTNSNIIGNANGGMGIENNGIISTINNSAGAVINGKFDSILNSGTITNINNSGAITSEAWGIFNNTGAIIGTLTNNLGGTISASTYIGIANYSTINTLSNSGTITGITTAIYNQGAIGTMTNSGTISADDFGINNNDTITSLTSSGTISGGSTGVYNNGTITSLTNNGTIIGSTLYSGIWNLTGAAIGTLTNNTGALISGVTAGIYNDGAIDTLTNSGTISGGSSAIYNNSTIGTLTNLGVITGGNDISIYNNGTIATLINGQGGGAALAPVGYLIPSAVNGAAPLAYSGALPGAYVAHITSPSNYGQLVYTGTDTNLASFSITSDSTLAATTYTDVLSGIGAVDGELTGTLGKFQWTLLEQAALAGNWDLVVSMLYSADAGNTLQALGLSRDQLLSALRNRAANATYALSYDCTDFGKNNVCVSLNARYSSLDGQNEVAGVLTAAYRLSATTRLGVFVDYAVDRENKLSGILDHREQPMFGGFVGYSQQAGGMGVQARVSGAYHAGKVSILRSGALEDTEAGMGNSNLKSWAVGGELGYGAAFTSTSRVMPFVGLRYGYAGRKGYAEAGSDAVQFPISYADYRQRILTAETGLLLNGVLRGNISYKIGGGIEFDLKSTANNFAGTSSLEGLETFSLANDASNNKARGHALAEIGYNIAPTAKFTLAVSARGEAYSSKTNANIMAGLQVGF